MLPITPSYTILTYLFVMVCASVIIEPRRPLLALTPGVTLIILYGENGKTGALMITLLAAVISALLSAVRDD